MPDTSPAPAVSVLMSAYNAARYVRQAIESILGQTFTDFELILIDDGSTDGTRALLEPLAQRDARVRFVSRPNKGLTKTLNEALHLARGEFVARMDADDIALPQRFEKQVAFLREHADCVCVGSRVMLIDPLGATVEPQTDHKLTHEEIDRDLLAGIGWSIVHPAAMMRRQAMLRVGGYREQFKTSQDLDLFLRLAEIGRLANLPDVLLKYRQHFESVNFSKFDEQWRVKSIIVKDAYDRRGLTPPAEWKFRPRTIRSHAEQLRHWAWAALKHGNVQAARRHALASLRRMPFSRESWRVTYCALRGR